MRALPLAAALAALSVPAFAALAGPAHALKPETAAFLKKNGFDPASPQIARIAEDKVGDASLDSIADDGDKKGLRQFVATRNFIRAFMKDTETPFPEDGLYAAEYLNEQEQSFVARALRESWSRITMKG